MKPTKKARPKVAIATIRTITTSFTHPDPVVQLASIALRVAQKKAVREALRAAA